MQVGRPGVKYGLTVPKAKQKQQAPAKKQNLFGAEDSDDDGQAGVEQQIARQAARKQTDKKVGRSFGLVATSWGAPCSRQACLVCVRLPPAAPSVLDCTALRRRAHTHPHPHTARLAGGRYPRRRPGGGPLHL